MTNNINSSRKWLSKISLPVSKRWLYLFAGLVWSGVGILLNKYTYLWLHNMAIRRAITYLLLGIILAIVIYLWGFSKLARRNIHRIQKIDSRTPSIFAFQKWTSYPLVAVMIAMGIYLRKFSPVPKHLLASLYTGIGGGLLLSSFLYYRKVWEESVTAKASRK